MFSELVDFCLVIDSYVYIGVLMYKNTNRVGVLLWIVPEMVFAGYVIALFFFLWIALEGVLMGNSLAERVYHWWLPFSVDFTRIMPFN